MEKIRMTGEVKTYTKVCYLDFEYFISEIYNGEINFMECYNAHNYASYEFSAPNSNMDFDGKYESKIRNGDFEDMDIHALFNVLYKDGHIEKGNYLINVWF